MIFLRLIKTLHLAFLSVAVTLSMLSLIAQHANAPAATAQTRDYNDGVSAERVNSLADRMTKVEDRTRDLEKSSTDLGKEVQKLHDDFDPVKDAIFWTERLFILLALFIIGAAAKPHIGKLTRVFTGGFEP